MKQTIFASDLDNTLIFSYKHALDTDLCVEYLDGKPQGYLPPTAPAMLEELMEKALFTPLPTPWVDHYWRIHSPPGCRPWCGAPANGGILLDGGEVDQAWRQESLELVRPWRQAMEEVLAALGKQPQARRFRMVDELFVFAACDDSQQALTLRERLRDRTPLDVEVTGRKVYCFPPSMNKGAAVDRLRARFGAERVICAGDSPIDRPMLERADVAIVPHGQLAQSLPCRETVVCGPEERFYEFVLRQAAARIG